MKKKKEYRRKKRKNCLPKDGLLFWIQLPKGVNSVGLYRNQLPEGIVILPGPVCSSSQVFEGYIRLGCAFLFDDVMENALKRIGHHVRMIMENR